MEILLVIIILILRWIYIAIRKNSDPNYTSLTQQFFIGLITGYLKHEMKKDKKIPQESPVLDDKMRAKKLEEIKSAFKGYS